MARIKNQSARRQELLDAAEVALLDRGQADLRVKDIADIVGLTPPAVSYYYPDLDQLVIEVYRRVTQRFVDMRRASIATIDDPKRKLASLIEHGVPSGPEDHDALLTYQMAGDPRTGSAYRILSATLFTTEVVMYESVIEHGRSSGDFSPALPSDVIARALVGMEDAYGLRVTMNDAGIDHHQAVSEIRRVAESLLGVRLDGKRRTRQLAATKSSRRA